MLSAELYLKKDFGDRKQNYCVLDDNYGTILWSFYIIVGCRSIQTQKGGWTGEKAIRATIGSVTMLVGK